MHRTRIKMCGIKQVEDAVYAAKLGVDAIGLVFYDKSPRNISIEQAKAVVSNLPSFVTTVGLFYNASASEVSEIIQSVHLDCLQFHGNESSEFCQSFTKPYIKAIPMLEENIKLPAVFQQYQTASGLMLDAMDQSSPGGSGKVFDWSSISKNYSSKIILAGGLTPENVAEAITLTTCYAVDVSSGIEIEKGVKDQKRMLAFSQAVKQIDERINEQ